MKTLAPLFFIIVLAVRANAQPNEIVLDSAFSQLKGNGAAGVCQDALRH